MNTRKLQGSDWQRYFDEVAKRIPSMRVAVSIVGEDIGAQHENEDSALVGISYDRGSDVLTIDMANASHRISSPSEIYVQEEGGMPSSIEVVVPDGTKQIIELKPLPSLPAS
jgi:hypothetical protein